MSKLSFSKRLWIQLFVSLACILAVAVFSMIEMRSVRIEERKAMLGRVSDTAMSIIKHYGDKAERGELSKEQAQAEALAAVRVLRYGKNGYFSIADQDVNILLSPFMPQLEHTNAAQMADKNGFHVWAESIRIARSEGQGFIQYVWAKPGSSEPVPKIGYVAAYAPWGWMLVTGTYIDDINASVYESVVRTIVAVLVLAAVLIAVMLAVNRSLRRSLGGEPEYAVEIVRQIAGHDLSAPVRPQGNNASSVLHSMQEMQAQLAGIIASVKALAEAISIGSSEIAAGNLDLSQRTERQAAALQQTASSMEELNATVGKTDENATATQAVVHETLLAAKAGSDVVGRMVASMHDIDREATQISGIVDLIDSIAFQTNILSLNAAVEAARAGEQGRGFAVVAAEVRTLAQRSSSASKEIAALIQNSRNGVEQGTRYAQQAGEAMDKIEGAVRRMTSSTSEILDASKEQSSGIAQISIAVAEIDKVTQQNAALVEQIAAAASALETQAASLRTQVSSFRLPDDVRLAV
ncbi:methyl-accepting chemotaxis protein [Burkholderia sp. 3C]